MNEIAPGVVHWPAWRETIHGQVSSYYAVGTGIVLDPMPPAEGWDALAERYGAPTAVVLTNRHHYRFAGELESRYGATIHCHEAGMHEFTHGQHVLPFAFGDVLPGGAIAYEVGAICPEETAVWFPDERALAIADGFVRIPPEAPLGFVPDELLGDDRPRSSAGCRRPPGASSSSTRRTCCSRTAIPSSGAVARRSG